MALKRYLSVYPQMIVGPIQFRSGEYETSDHDEQAMIEGCDTFSGGQIKLVDEVVALTPSKLKAMNKAQLYALAEERQISLIGNETKDDLVVLLTVEE